MYILQVGAVEVISHYLPALSTVAAPMWAEGTVCKQLMWLVHYALPQLRGMHDLLLVRSSSCQCDGLQGICCICIQPSLQGC
jgi:hypothetical protein